MSDTDVRDLGGRAVRLLASIVIGMIGTVVIVVLIPCHGHLHVDWRDPWLGGGGMNPLLVALGACPIALACYAVLGALARRRPVAGLPRARVVRPRARGGQRAGTRAIV